MTEQDVHLGDLLIQKCHRGKLPDVIELLKDPEIDVNYKDHNGCTALHAAAASGQLNCVQCVAAHPDCDLTAVDDDEQSVVHYASFHGHLEVVQLLVSIGVPLDLPDKLGRLAHISACMSGHPDVVRHLLEECNGALSIQSIDEYGNNALHWAAVKGRKQVVSYLCHAGIDVYVTSFDNKTALQLAKDRHKGKCMQFLTMWMERLQQFLTAAEEGNNAELDRIISEVNNSFPLRFLRDKDGRNAIHCAASSGHLSTLKVLAKHFDQLIDVDKYGRNALHWAALGGHKECAMWLVMKGRGTSLVHSLTLTEKSPSRCAFEAGRGELAAKLQSFEEGNDELYTGDNAPMTGGTPFSYARTENRIPGVNESDNRDDEEMASRDSSNIVDSWLKQANMVEYTTQFKQDGFDTLRGIATIDEKDLIDMDVKKGHRRLVLSRVGDLKQQLAIMDNMAQSIGEEPEASPSLAMLPPALGSTAAAAQQQSPPSVPTLVHSSSTDGAPGDKAVTSGVQ